MLTDLSERRPLDLLIVFTDLTGFSKQARKLEDDALAAAVDELYERIDGRVAPAGGLVVKFIGDACLMVFAEDNVDRAVTVLLDLKESIDAWLSSMGWPCRMMVKAHFGRVIAGPYGGPGRKRFDVIGNAVNTAAMLDSTGVALSVAAFRKLSSELRKQFKKHTPPVTYIRHDDPRRFRYRA